MKLPITGGSEFSKFSDVTMARTINWYPVKSSSGKNELILMPTPGWGSTSSVSPSSGTGCRGVVHNNLLSLYGNTAFVNTTAVTGLTTTGTYGRMYGCSGGNLASPTEYDIFCADSAVYVVSGVVSSAYHGWKLDGGNATPASTASATTANKLVNTVGTPFATGVYPGMVVHNTTDDTYATITAVDSSTALSINSDIFTIGEGYEIKRGYNIPWTSPTCAVFMDGYYIVNDNTAGTRGRFYISSLYDPNRWSTVDFGVAEKEADTITAMAVNDGLLYLFGNNTLEIRYNSGNTTFPFEQIQSGYLTYGCSNQSLITNIKGSLILLANTKGDSKILVSIKGTDVQEIKSTELNNAISVKNYSSAGHLSSWSWNGSDFIALREGTSASTDSSLATVIYDLSSGFVHEMSPASNTSSEITFREIVSLTKDTWRIYFTNANTYATLSYKYTNQAGTAVKRERILPITHSDDNIVYHEKIEVDINNNEGFYNTTGYSATYLLTDFIDFTTIGIVNNSDVLYNPYDGSTDIIDAVPTSNTISTVTSNAIKYTESPFDILTTDGNKRVPIVLYLQYRDNGGQWSTAKARTINKHKDRAIWRKLGKSTNRIYKIYTTSISPVAILAGYFHASSGLDDG